MKKIFLLVLCSVVVFFMFYKQKGYKSVNERDVPERYVNDLKETTSQMLKKEHGKWLIQLPYNVNFIDNGNQMRIKLSEIWYTNPMDSSFWSISHLKSLIILPLTYANSKIEEVSIADFKNKKKTYHAKNTY